jgi:arsenate reductase-like glutaredoxin family protein
MNDLILKELLDKVSQLTERISKLENFFYSNSNANSVINFEAQPLKTLQVEENIKSSLVQANSIKSETLEIGKQNETHLSINNFEGGFGFSTSNDDKGPSFTIYNDQILLRSRPLVFAQNSREGANRYGIHFKPYYVAILANGFEGLRVKANYAEVEIVKNITSQSDMALKTNISKLSNVLKKLKNINGVYFNWKDQLAKGVDKKQIGLIAQEVEEQFPELISTSVEGYKTLDYSKFCAVLLEAIKELSDKYEILEKQSEKLS